MKLQLPLAAEILDQHEDELPSVRRPLGNLNGRVGRRLVDNLPVDEKSIVLDLSSTAIDGSLGRRASLKSLSAALVDPFGQTVGDTVIYEYAKQAYWANGSYTRTDGFLGVNVWHLYDEYGTDFGIDPISFGDCAVNPGFGCIGVFELRPWHREKAWEWPDQRKDAWS